MTVVDRKFLSTDLRILGVPPGHRTRQVRVVNKSVQNTTYETVFNLTGTFALVKLASYRATANANNGHIFRIYVDGTLILTKTISDYSGDNQLPYPIFASTSLRIDVRSRYAALGEYARAEIMEFLE
jgi:hypothetical protein